MNDFGRELPDKSICSTDGKPQQRLLILTVCTFNKMDEFFLVQR